MAVTMTTEEKLESILIATELTNTECATLWDSFFVFSPIVFAKTLYARVTVPDSVKGQLLALKIAMPPEDSKKQQDAVVAQAIEASMGRFWNRLATGVEG